MISNPLAAAGAAASGLGVVAGGSEEVGEGFGVGREE